MRRSFLIVLLVCVISAISMIPAAFADDMAFESDGDLTRSSIDVAAAEDAAITVQSGLSVQSIEVDPSGSADKQREAIQNALNEHKDAATDDLVITLGKGASYEINGKLRIYSRTTLDMNGATITRTGTAEGEGVNDGMLLNYPIGWNGTKGVQRESAEAGGYNMSTNITVKNGTLNGGNVKKATNNSNLMRIDHASDIVIENVNFKNVYGNHHLEFIGVKDGRISNCTFEGFEYINHKKAYETGREALELDAAWTDNPGSVGSDPTTWGSGRWASDTYLDGTHDENCVVENCTFTDLPVAVGEHHYSSDSRCSNSKNITIRNNTITATASLPYKPAITAWGMDDLTISGNTVNGAYPFHVQTGHASNVTISGNSFSGAKQNAIMLDNSATGVKVANNTVSNSSKHGISVTDASVDSISGNTVNAPKGNGINVNSGTVLSIESNTVTSAGNHGISILGGTVTDISNNSVTKAAKNGVNIGKDAKSGTPTVSNITGNTLKNSTVHGVSVVLGTVGSIASNKITKTGKTGSGICLTSGKITTIKSNTISNAGKNGISVIGGSVGTKGKSDTGILGNTVKKTSTGMGITVSKKGAAANINKNKVTNPAKNGISFTGKVKVYNVKSNKVTIKKKSGYFGIWIGGKSVKTKVRNNTVTVPQRKYAIGRATGAKFSVSGNKVKVKG